MLSTEKKVRFKKKERKHAFDHKEKIKERKNELGQEKKESNQDLDQEKSKF